ncbi:mitochondrial distribution and morphology protein family 31/32, partial [Hanseniaspora valbyensis NRRL Y-1626]
MKPFNADDISAFMSFIIWTHLTVILLWTTGFVSLIILLLNTVMAQNYLATKFGELITNNNSNNSLIIFENAILPDLKSGKIVFQNVFVSKRPRDEQDNKFIKGSQLEAVTRAKLALQQQQRNYFQFIFDPKFKEGNYTQYDLTIKEIIVSLSFVKWFQGKGLIEEMTVNGIRGVMDRTNVHWEEGDDPRNYLNVKKPGDFDIDNFKMNDVLFTLYPPDGLRPFKVSIYTCELDKLRQQWFFYDFLNANFISGKYDGSLFTINKRYNSRGHLVTTWRVDNLNIDNLNGGVQGPFSWITSGKVDMVGDIRIRPKLKEVPEKENKQRIEFPFKGTDFWKKILYKWQQHLNEEYESQELVLDYYLKLHDVHAEVPIINDDLNIWNSALIRPIVSYINSNNMYIPIRCQIVKPLNDFDGSWTIYDSTLNDDLNEQVFHSLQEYVIDEERRSLRLKKIGFWSLQLILQVILVSLGSI